MKKGEENKFQQLFPQGWRDNLSLYKLIKTPAVEILQAVSEAYLYEKSRGLNPKIPAILITSTQRGLGAETIARAFANSIGNSLTVGLAASLGCYDIRAFFTEAPPFATFYIMEGDKLNLFNQQILYKLITESIIDIPDNSVRKLNPVFIDNFSVIVSTTDARKIAPSLLKVFKIQVRLSPFSNQQITEMMKVKSSFYRVATCPDALQYIALKADGNPYRAERLWFSAVQLMKAEGQKQIEIKHIRRASVLTVDKYP